MSKYFQFALVVLYATFFIGAFFIVINATGLLHGPLRDSLVFITIVSGSLVCFAAAWFLADYWLLFQEVRRPVREEEQKLLKCLDDIQKRTGKMGKYRLRIQDETGVNAFAVGRHTIVVSTGSLEELTDNELTAVVAREFGHLQTRDDVAAIAYTCASWLPAKFNFLSEKFGVLVLGWTLRYFLLLTRIGIVRSLILLTITGWVCWRFHIFHYLTPAIGLILLTRMQESIFRPLWLLNCRQSAYRQDTFVQEIGLDRDLQTALQKTVRKLPQKTGFHPVYPNDHRVISERIRRLENPGKSKTF